MLLLDHDEKSIHIHIPKRQALTYVNHQQEGTLRRLQSFALPWTDWSFKFSKILHNASQATVYRECVEDVVKQVFEGYNGTVIAYGQTGVSLILLHELSHAPQDRARHTPPPATTTPHTSSAA